MLTLICPPGAADSGAPISQGGAEYPVYRPDPRGSWLIDVPPEVAAPLMHNGGFVMVEAPRSGAASGVVLVHHPDPAVTAGTGTADDAGNFWVRAEHAAQLIASHGFCGGARPVPAAAEGPGQDAQAAMPAELRQRLEHRERDCEALTGERNALLIAHDEALALIDNLKAEIVRLAGAAHPVAVNVASEGAPIPSFAPADGEAATPAGE